MDLVLHIGAEKTGTTAIQLFLDANADILARNNLWYCHAWAGQGIEKLQYTHETGTNLMMDFEFME